MSEPIIEYYYVCVRACVSVVCMSMVFVVCMSVCVVCMSVWVVCVGGVVIPENYE